jgi:HEAT repeat protein
MHDPSLTYTRDVLLARGKAIIPMLEAQQHSGDWRRQLAAEALLLRLQKPDLAAQWDQAIRHCGYDSANKDYAAVLDKPGKVTIKGNDPNAASVTLDGQAVPLLVEHLWLHNHTNLGYSGDERILQQLFGLLGHIGDARATRPLLDVHCSYNLTQPRIDAIVAIGKPAAASLIDALNTNAGAETASYYDTLRLRMICDILGRIGDKSAVEPLMKLLAGTPQHGTAAAAAEALAALGAKEAAEPIAARLVQLLNTITKRNYCTGDYGDDTFNGLCHALGKLSPQSAAAVGAAAKRMQKSRWQFLLSGLQIELADAEHLAAYQARFPGDPFSGYGTHTDIPVPDGEVREVGLGKLMVNAAWAMWAPWQNPHLPAVGREKAPGALEFLVDSLDSPGAIDGLGLLGDTRAVGPLAKLLAKGEPRGPDAARAIYRIGGEEALAALRSAAKSSDDPRLEVPQQSLRDLARAFVLALEKKNDELASLLRAETPELRQAAAEGLARLGDVRGVPVLLQQAAASEAGEYRRLRELLLSLGKQALPAIKQAHDPNGPLALRVAGDAVAFQISKPELCLEFDKRLEEAWGKVSGMHVITPGMIFGAGSAAGRGQPKELTPYVESLVLFRLGVCGVAAGALPELAQKRSIPVLLQAVRRGLDSRLAALALQAFGEKGLDAARNLPPPDPDKAAYAERSGRSRAGTQTLALAKDPAGIDQLVEALTSTWRLAGEDGNSPEAQRRRQAWGYRVEAVIRAANAFHDQRLFDAMLKLYQSPDAKSIFGIRDRVFDAMVRYDDARLVPILKTVAVQPQRDSFGQIAAPRSLEYSTIQATAVGTLAARPDVNAMDILLGSLDAGQPEATRLAAVAAMYLLVRRDVPKGHADWPAVAASRLEGLLSDPSGPVQHRAAVALAEMNVRAAAPRLARWLSTDDPPTEPVVYRLLGQSGDKTLGPKLLKIFQQRRWWFVADALGNLGYEDAVSELALELRRPKKNQNCEPIAMALVRLGPEGIKQAGAALRDTRDRGALGALLKALERQGKKAAGQWDMIADKLALLGRGYDQAFDQGDLSPSDLASYGRSREESALKAMTAIDPVRSKPILQRLAVEHEDPRIRQVALDLLRRQSR